MYEVSLFVFSRDLRIYDNTALVNALNESKKVIPCYFFKDEVEVLHKSNPFWSYFLIESLQSLNKTLINQKGRLFLFTGNMMNHLLTIKKSTYFNAIFLNHEYSPYWNSIKQNLESLNVPIYISEDYLLNKPESVLTTANNPFQVFTPFFNTARVKPVRIPSPIYHQNFFTEPLPEELDFSPRKWGDLELKKHVHFHGGRENGLKILKNLKKFKNYAVERDIPSINGTTSLSAHLNLGTCSIRETYHEMVNQLGIDHPLVRQLYWREFYVYVANHYPHVFSSNFREKYDHLEWINDEELMQKWKDGMTGFPIIDAGIRQLNQTGFMHNRVRMIVGSFLTKDLHIDWKLGEKYFAEKLTDFDPMLNNGNWQWIAGTGCDAAPYFRVFNPWTQQKKHDPECIYIKRWIPELQDVESQKIHNIYKKPLSDSVNYPKPILDHSKERINALAMYKSVK
ncbi:MAG: deoxyribodipyrimidine photo-lyase [Candidatus Lokiarchaeota archaeon]|nr:deoxyribodipyrimidine photo-lyase [Candidatus Lokiarchaeota archaeon]